MKCQVVILGLMTALSLGLGSSARAEPFVCPDLSVGETQQDCPWAAVARDLVANASSARGIMPRLQQQLPDLYADIQADSGSKFMKGLWGQSINFDEIAKATTVHPAILDALTSFFNVPAAVNNVVHAGTIHTYGYLFSVLKTPFGFKRDRWVSGKLEKGLGIPIGTLGPTPSEGTLYTNVTYLAARVAFRDDAHRIARLEREAKPAQALKAYKFKGISIHRIEETALVKEPGSATAVEVTLFTDFLMYPNPSPDNAALLVYSVREGKDPARLITAFPVDRAFVDRMLQPSEFGDNKPVQTRYNAFVKSLTGKTAAGSRQLIKD